jgi:hypothetical protein
VIDIPLKNDIDLYKIIMNLVQCSPSIETLLRFSGLLEELDVVFLTLQLNYTTVKVYPITIAYGSCEVWLHFIVKHPLRACGVYIETPGTWADYHPIYPDLSYLGGGKEYLLSVVLGPYQDFLTENIEDGITELSTFLEASVGDLDHRFTYSQFTELLHAFICRSVLMSDEPEHMIMTIINNKGINITLHLRNTFIALSDQLRRRLTHTLSRLLPYSHED